MIRRSLRRLIRFAGYDLIQKDFSYVQDGLSTLHNDHFRSRPEFRSAYQRGIQASHGVDPEFEWRVHIALWAAEAGCRVPGDFVECGVNAGFMSSAIMHYLGWKERKRQFYLVDTFAGPVLDQFTNDEIHRGRLHAAKQALAAGAYVTDLDRIRANYAEWSDVVIVQGTVPGVLPKVQAAEIAFLHLDMNCALPERAALEFFWARLSRGAVVLLDDYAFTGYEEQARAIDESMRQLGANVLSLPTGQGLIIR